MAVYVLIDSQTGHICEEWLACYTVYVKNGNDP